ncbi:MAG: hypothetical protein ACRDRN_10250 [Sciscionella sp.]
MSRVRTVGAAGNDTTVALRFGERLRIAPDRPGCAREWRVAGYPRAVLRATGGAAGRTVEFDAIGLGSGTVRLTATAASVACVRSPTTFSLRVRVLRELVKRPVVDSNDE